MTVLLEYLDLHGTPQDSIAAPGYEGHYGSYCARITVTLLLRCPYCARITVTLLLRCPECTGKIYFIVRSFVHV